MFLVTLVTHEVAGLKAETVVGLEQGGYAFLNLTLSFASLAVAFLVVFCRFGIGGDNTFEVAENNLAGALGDNVVRHNGGLTTTTRSVYHEGWNGIA